MYYILHGEDEFQRSEQVAKFRAQMGDPQFADLNTTRLDGRKLSLSELQHACDAVPFLTDRRLVIVEGLLTRLEARRKKGAEDGGEEESEPADPALANELREYLKRLPESARLVFVEGKTLGKANPFVKSAEADKQHAHVKEFKEPRARALTDWIVQRAAAKGGSLQAGAAEELAAHVGPDLRLLDNEIDKLMTYRNREAVRVEDVRALVASVRESDVFALVDALGRRDAAAALRLLHAQLDQDAAPQYLLIMIVRQFRLLLQMKDLGARGQSLDTARETLKLHPFVAQKVWEQARNFSLPQLEAIYCKLLDTDLAIKTGRSDASVALDLLIGDLTR